MSGLDNRFISSLELEPYFVSNQNGEANAGGIVTFYKDNARTVKKLVYQLTQATPGVYSYVALPDPITLSGVGTFQNAGGDNIAVYYYPYDSFGNQELYYITVYDAFGNLQFTREAWPYPNLGSSGSSVQAPFAGLTNQLSNPQFALINFVPTALTITIVGATTTTVPIAPDWSLVIISTGNSSVVVTQTPVAGSSKLPYNPPFTLDFTISANISSVQLIQKLNNNPDWASPQTTGVMGYLATSILLGAGTSVNVQYAPSSGTATQTLLNKTNTSGGYEQENATVQLAPGLNPATGATGFDQIIINILNLPGTASISNVQVIPVTTNVSGVQYDQTPVNRQIDHLFNYYNSQLQFKPIPSYLVGWDFTVAPFQPLANGGGPYAIGANKSIYINETTIVFQSANSGFSFQRGTSGALRLVTAATTQLALIQYLPGLTSSHGSVANGILFDKICSMIKCATDQTNGYAATVSLWATTNVSLPSAIGANLSVVTTLDANGHPSAVVAGWTEIARSNLGNAQFTVQTPGITNPGLSFNYYPFSGWLDNGTLANAATWLAIVVGTGVITSGKNFSVESISLQSGDIPTIPAPQSLGEVLADCQQYYEMSFNIGTVPAQNVGAGTGEFDATQAVAASTATGFAFIPYKVTKWTIPTTISTYNPAAANGQIRNLTVAADCSGTTLANSNQDGFLLTCTSAIGSAAGNVQGVHWVSDARLGQ